jgi:xylan 1,4-beta-xylosidase
LEKTIDGKTQRIAEQKIPGASEMKFKITGEARAYSFFYDANGNGWTALKEREDGTILSTEVAGGFVGAVIGPYARAE